jgi:alkanesulfonate monooxygenase SsuD/methylene tetrahydromethanopterin reductase-like flavin-dependent oxidoreductase (luciferase family)
MGRGRRFRQGGRFGWGLGASSQPFEEEKDLLEEQKNWLESQLTAIKQRIQNLVETPKGG